MQIPNKQLQLGIGACLAAAFLAFYMIPTWVSAPSNIRNIVLSPLLWPYALAGCTALIGLGLVLSGLRGAARPDTAEPQPGDDVPDRAAAWARLLAMAAIMGATIYLLPRLGMVWTAMLSFAASAFVMRTRHPRTALVCALVIPLALYAFFAHVAGVAIPQGEFVRLP